MKIFCKVRTSALEHNTLNRQLGTNLLDIVGQFIGLKKMGHNFFYLHQKKKKYIHPLNLISHTAVTNPQPFLIKRRFLCKHFNRTFNKTK